MISLVMITIGTLFILISAIIFMIDSMIDRSVPKENMLDKNELIILVLILLGLILILWGSIYDI